MVNSESFKVYVLLFENFTALDVFGPVEVLSGTGRADIHYVSADGGTVTNKQGRRIDTEPVDSIEEGGVLLVPGGMGTRSIINDGGFIEKLSEAGRKSENVLCVCTGSALAARAGLLDGKKATSNKKAFEWATSGHDRTKWNREARWVRDGDTYTSAGVSAGIDMALGFVTDLLGAEKADEIASRIEYHRNMDADHDTF